MASCQQYESQICGDNDQQKAQPQPHIQEQIVRVSCNAYPNKDLDIKNGMPTLLNHNLVKPTQIWKKEVLCNNDQQKPGPIPSVFKIVSKATGQALRAEGDKVVLTDEIIRADVLWTEEGGYIISTYGTVWTAKECQQDIEIMLQAKTGQANQQWNFKNILPPN